MLETAIKLEIQVDSRIFFLKSGYPKLDFKA